MSKQIKNSNMKIKLIAYKGSSGISPRSFSVFIVEAKRIGKELMKKVLVNALTIGIVGLIRQYLGI